MLNKERRALVREHLWVAEAATRSVLPRRGLAPEDEDLLGEAFLALCEAALSWEPSKGSFPAYAWERVRRAVLEIRRREAQLSLRSAALAGAAQDEAGPAGGPVRDELVAALMLLPPRWRAVVNLCFFRGLEAHEAARLLGISPSRVSQIKRKALARLRATLLD